VLNTQHWFFSNFDRLTIILSLIVACKLKIGHVGDGEVENVLSSWGNMDKEYHGKWKRKEKSINV
jgi:hypothetical protein